MSFFPVFLTIVKIIIYKKGNRRTVRSSVGPPSEKKGKREAIKKFKTFLPAHYRWYDPCSRTRKLIFRILRRTSLPVQNYYILLLYMRNCLGRKKSVSTGVDVQKIFTRRMHLHFCFSSTRYCKYITREWHEDMLLLI